MPCRAERLCRVGRSEGARQAIRRYGAIVVWSAAAAEFSSIRRDVQDLLNRMA